jgi:predicted DCC family thiol-disulfide oxidoreductase YuxK
LITVIYDGQCRFCRACLDWLEEKVKVEKFAYQDTDTTRFGLSKEECSKQVYIQHHGQLSAGASAIAILLKVRGNRISAFLIRLSGPLAAMGYRWVAAHRNSLLIRVATKILERRTEKT